MKQQKFIFSKNYLFIETTGDVEMRCQEGDTLNLKAGNYCFFKRDFVYRGDTTLIGLVHLTFVYEDNVTVEVKEKYKWNFQNWVGKYKTLNDLVEEHSTLIREISTLTSAHSNSIEDNATAIEKLKTTTSELVENNRTQDTAIQELKALTNELSESNSINKEAIASLQRSTEALDNASAEHKGLIDNLTITTTELEGDNERNKQRLDALELASGDKVDSNFKNIYPVETNKYVVGSSSKRWNNIYTNTINATAVNTSSINNTGTVQSYTVLPSTSGNGYVGSTSNYFNSGAMNTIYTNYLKTLASGYHLASTSTASTSWYTHNANAESSTSSKTYGGSINWQGVIINSYPMKFAILTGHGIRAYNGTPTVADKMIQVMLPTGLCKFKSSSDVVGYSYYVHMAALQTSYAGGGNSIFSDMPLIRTNDADPSWFDRTLDYFCVNGDLIANTPTGFQILVAGFIS